MDNFWWALLFVTFYIPFMFLWGFTLVDVMLRKDMHAWSKILWALVILFLPLAGVLIYFIARPKDYSNAVDSSMYADNRAMTAAGPMPSAREASDLDALASMHEKGVLTDSEFDSIRGRVSPAT